MPLTTPTRRRPRRPRATRIGALVAAAALSVALAPAALASGGTRTATHSERSAILKVLKANDGSTSGVTGVYVSRSNSALAIVCERSPEGGPEAYVFTRSGSHWRLSAFGRARHAGNSTDRSLETVCH